MMSMRFAQRIVDLAEGAGVARAELLLAAELDPVQLQDSEARLPRSHFRRLLEHALDLTGDPALGLHWCAGMQASNFAPISYLVTHAANLRQAFELIDRFGRLLTDRALPLGLIEHEDCVEVRHHSHRDTPPRVARFAAEMLVSSLATLVRFFNPRASFVRVSFMHPAPPYAAQYTRFFGQEVCFEQPCNGIVFDRALLDERSPHDDAGIRETLRALAEQRVTRLTGQVPYSRKVHDFLVRQREPRKITMQTVAQALGISVRSLRRRLAAEGRSYQHVESEALAAAAKRLLRDDKRSIQEAAYEMGFADTTAFHRAFKRWTGMTPTVYRGG